MDGCFDMMHYGHANALRQVRSASALPAVGTHAGSLFWSNIAAAEPGICLLIVAFNVIMRPLRPPDLLAPLSACCMAAPPGTPRGDSIPLQRWVTVICLKRRS